MVYRLVQSSSIYSQQQNKNSSMELPSTEAEGGLTASSQTSLAIQQVITNNTTFQGGSIGDPSFLSIWGVTQHAKLTPRISTSPTGDGRVLSRENYLEDGEKTRSS